METIKILIVDDEQEILDEAAEALNEEGYEALCANGVGAALDILRRHGDIGVIVTDLKMPGMSGADLINEVRADFARDISFIVMSGHGNPAGDIEGLDIEGLFFLRKPMDIDRFLEAVEAAASSNGGRDQGGGANDGQGIDRR